MRVRASPTCCTLHLTHIFRRPMHLAASENQIAVVRFLVDECGVDPSPEDRCRERMPYVYHL